MSLCLCLYFHFALSLLTDRSLQCLTLLQTQVAVTASRTRGATAELGQAMQKVVARHHSVRVHRSSRSHLTHSSVRATPLVRAIVKFTVKTAVRESLRRWHMTFLTVKFALTLECTSDPALIRCATLPLPNFSL